MIKQVKLNNIKDNNKNFAVSGVFRDAMLDVIKSLHGNEGDDEHKLRLAVTEIIWADCPTKLVETLIKYTDL